jgi:hypothetical protein
MNVQEQRQQHHAYILDNLSSPHDQAGFITVLEATRYP